MKSYSILFCCGDTSADMYLAMLLNQLNLLSPEIKKIVVAGDKSKHFSDEFLINLVNYDAHGFFSPLTQFFKFVKLLNFLKNYIKQNKINLVVLLDFYGFNIHLAKIAKTAGIKVVYYITPQIWASRFYRIKKIKKYVDYVINIYPFEQELFLKHEIKSFYFGHPIVDIFNIYKIQQKEKNLIGIFPGSRKQVVKWNLPTMLKICQHYLQHYSKDKVFIIFGFEKFKKLYNSLISKYVPISLRKNIKLSFSQQEREKIYLSVSVSGTVVLENMFYNIPTIVVYNLPQIMYWLLKKIVYVNYISLPNIIAGYKIVPEFIKENINVEKICETINILLTNENEYKEILDNYAIVKQKLTQYKNVTLQVAEKLIQTVYEKS